MESKRNRSFASWSVNRSASVKIVLYTIIAFRRSFGGNIVSSRHYIYLWRSEKECTQRRMLNTFQPPDNRHLQSFYPCCLASNGLGKGQLNSTAAAAWPFLEFPPDYHITKTSTTSRHYVWPLWYSDRFIFGSDWWRIGLFSSPSRRRPGLSVLRLSLLLAWSKWLSGLTTIIILHNTQIEEGK